MAWRLPLLQLAFLAAAVLVGGLAPPLSAHAQAPAGPEGEKEEEADEKKEAEAPTRQSWGFFEPGTGFRVGKTEVGELNISGYMVGRYLNQLPADQSFVDHLGREREIDTRQDIQWHRILVYFTGWAYDPKLLYSVIFWTTNSTGQVAIVGALSYNFHDAFQLSVGIGPNAGSRSMLGAFPYFHGTDRQMADEFFRPGFTGGAWVTGEPLPRLHYRAMLGNSNSQLGINARLLTRDLSKSLSLWWMPTTGEFGPRGGYGDYEQHEEIATRIGASGVWIREDRFSQSAEAGPENTQIRLSDSLVVFDPDALAPGVTVQQLDYQMVAFDAGLKLRGAHLQLQYYLRWLDDFDADGPLPMDSIFDHGFDLQASYFAVPRRLAVYGATSYIWGEFNDAWEIAGGANFYPADTRNFRVNAHVIGVNRSPASSLFGYYVGGQEGVTMSLAADLFF